MWTIELEKQLQTVGNYAQGYVWMYKRDFQRLNADYTRASRIAFWIPIIAGTLGVISVGVGVDQTQIMVVVASIFSYFSAACQKYLQNMQYETNISDLKKQTAKYSGLLNNIKRQLSLPRNKRERADDYTRWILKNYDDLSDMAINIDDETIREYRLVCARDNIPFPDEGEHGIEIHVENHDEEKDEKENSGNGENKIVKKGEEKEKERDKPTLHTLSTLHTRTHTSLEELIRTEDKGVLVKDEDTQNVALQEALKYTDAHMKYELARFNREDESQED